MKKKKTNRVRTGKAPRAHNLVTLLEGEASYRSMIDVLPAGVLLLDGQGVIQMWNPSAEQILRLSPEQLRGQAPLDPLWCTIHEDGSPFSRETYPGRLSFEAGNPYSGVIMGVQQPNGTLTWTSMSSRIVSRTQEQKPDAVVVSFVDITEQHQAAHALREAERFARATVDALSTSIAILDETGTILTVNQAWRNFAQTNAPDVSGLGEGANYLQVCDAATGTDAETAVTFAAGIRAVMHRERPCFSLEYACHSPNEQRWFIGRVTRLAGEGSLRVVVAHDNITAWKQAEKRVKERERLAAIGTTAATFAHEVGNPLNSISTTLQLLDRRLRQHGGPLDDTIFAPVQRITTEIARLSGLLKDFRSLTSSEMLDFRDVQLGTLAGEIVSREASTYTAHGVAVSHAFPPDLPWISVDREKLRQVLMNLCTNAVEAMPQGGTLTLQARKTGEHVTLEIHDTGVGIPEGMDIFAPFVTTKTQGPGLGLTIAQQIVAAHGGSLTYRSTPGQGTIFTLLLPVAKNRD